ncbi:hypothetical protein IKG20_02450 [Candidatus Saccharibacteria bacterium]|nr:hypothetical protein [Candidatus Saccharibacteria bacterium]
MKDIIRAFADYESTKNHITNDLLPQTTASTTDIINVFLYIGGLAAVVMIIVGAVQMQTSAGNSGAVAKAKNTITFSVVGLVVMILAYAIVNFVVGKL